MVRRIVLVLSLLLAGRCFGQSVDTFTQGLMRPDSLGDGRVQVIEQGDASSIVSALRASRDGATVNGFRVCIFFANNQNADTQASEVLERFRALFPETPAYMNYENPYWKVSVGNCALAEEAIILRERISGVFPKAYVAKKNIPIAKMTE